jgi:hypothetical protein
MNLSTQTGQVQRAAEGANEADGLLSSLYTLSMIFLPKMP